LELPIKWSPEAVEDITNEILVKAFWANAASVWLVESEDIPGLIQNLQECYCSPLINSGNVLQHVAAASAAGREERKHRKKT